MARRSTINKWFNVSWLLSFLAVQATWAQAGREGGLPAAPTQRRMAPAGSRSSQYFGRGFDLEQGTDFALAVDGIPLNLPSTLRGPGYLDLNLLIPETLAGPTYHKGPYQAWQGAFATAGSAELEPVHALEGPLLKVAYGGAEEDRYGRLLWAETRSGLTYALEGTRSYRPWNQWEPSSRLNAYLRHAQNPSGLGWTFTLLATREQADGGTPRPERALPAHFDADWGDLRVGDGTRLRRLFLGASYQADRGGGVTDLFRIYGGASAQTDWATTTYFLRDDYWGDQIEQRERRAFLGAEAWRQWARTAGQVEWTHRVGFQTRFDRIGTAEVLATYDRERTVDALGAPLDPLMEAKGELVHGALFGQSSARWGEGWSAFAGARVDSQRNHVWGPRAGAPQDRTATLFSPKLGLAWSPRPATEFRAAWGQGFRLGNALRDTRPMIRAHSAEIGAQTQVRGPWETSVTLWRLDLEADTRFDAPSNANLLDQPSRHQGLEWYNEAKWGPWRAELCLAWSQARFRDLATGQDRVPGSIPRTGYLGVGWKQSGLAVDLKYRSLGGYALSADNRISAGRQEALELRLERDWGAWGAAVEVSNAFNLRQRNQEYYYVSRLPGEPAAGVADRHLKTSDPQAIRIELRRRF
jgi:outer membrane receptor protein involved in Fe transport